MSHVTVQDRMEGALLGAWIGEALGVGPHWYYSLEELRRDYGGWIDDYTGPKPGRYHDGLKAGQLSQPGFILKLMVNSLIARNGYDEADFCRRMDQELFPLMDGSPVSGPGGYTSQSIREAWRRRVLQGLDWSQTGNHADTTEAIERTLAIAVRYALRPRELASAITGNTLLTQNDDTVVSMTVAFGALLGLLVQGNRLDAGISGKLMKMVRSGELPFHAVTREGAQPPRPGDPDPPREGRFASPDALLSPSYMAAAAADPDIRFHSLRNALRHLTCFRRPIIWRPVFTMTLSAVLNALNGGGQNQVRAMLTGALTGAQVKPGIPQRFLDGLEDADQLQDMAAQLARQERGMVMSRILCHQERGIDSLLFVFICEYRKQYSFH
jgi:ADP-ribosylglycohydrolase